MKWCKNTPYNKVLNHVPHNLQLWYCSDKIPLMISKLINHSLCRLLLLFIDFVLCVLFKAQMNRLKLSYLGYIMQRSTSLEKSMIMGKMGGRRGRGWSPAKWIDSITMELEDLKGHLCSPEESTLIWWHLKASFSQMLPTTKVLQNHRICKWLLNLSVLSVQ